MSSAIRTFPPLWGAFDSPFLCQAKDDYDHRLFLVTNELNHAQTLKTLESAPQTGNLILSNSGLMTLNVFSRREQTEKMHVLVVDCSLRIQHFWQNFQSILAKENDRLEVVRCLMNQLDEHKTIYYRCSDHSQTTSENLFEENIADFFNEIEQGISWLSTRDRYFRVVQLFQEGRFHFKLGDWSSSELIDTLISGMSRTSLVLDTLVQNNIFEYCEDEGEATLDRYKRGLDRLISPTTWLVKTRSRCSCEKDVLVQRAVLRQRCSIDQLIPGSLVCRHVCRDVRATRQDFMAAHMLESLSFSKVSS